jgi:ribonucleoside-diphosphate reductase alpha chain
VLGSSSGIHARHSPYYLRRIRFSKDESISNYLQNIVPDLIEEDISSKNTIILTIPQESPSNAIVRADETAIDVFNRASLYYKNWVLPGHRTGEDTHNVSCTINVRDDEWNALQNIMWDQRNNYRAISLFPYDGGTYKQAPFEECTKEVFENYSNRIKDIDLREVREEEDNEAYLLDNVACAGGACEIR